MPFCPIGLGKVEMSTPFHSPQVPRRPLSCGRSSPPRARRKALSFDYLNRGTNGIERELMSFRYTSPNWLCGRTTG
nr:uncharacterized protein LOC104103240 isoform X2 [Nicotiana tomentosiformis]